MFCFSYFHVPLIYFLPGKMKWMQGSKMTNLKLFKKPIEHFDPSFHLKHSLHALVSLFWYFSIWSGKFLLAQELVQVSITLCYDLNVVCSQRSMCWKLWQCNCIEAQCCLKEVGFWLEMTGLWLLSWSILDFLVKHCWTCILGWLCLPGFE
jgi:hypothetical protein